MSAQDGDDALLGCEVAAAILATFARLRTHGKPQAHEHTVLAGFAVVYAHIEDRQSEADLPAKPPVCVALATGTKCLGATQRSALGALLNDSHAEVHPEHCLEAKTGEGQVERTLNARSKTEMGGTRLVLGRALERACKTSAINGDRECLQALWRIRCGIGMSLTGNGVSVERSCRACAHQVHTRADYSPSSLQVLARRALQRWLHGELAVAASGEAASVLFARAACGRFRPRGAWRLCMFASQPPCGDACVAVGPHAACAGLRSQGPGAAEALGCAAPRLEVAWAAEGACAETSAEDPEAEVMSWPAVPQATAADSGSSVWHAACRGSEPATCSDLSLLGAPWGFNAAAAGVGGACAASQLPASWGTGAERGSGLQAVPRTGVEPLGPGGALPGEGGVKACELASTLRGRMQAALHASAASLGPANALPSVSCEKASEQAVTSRSGVQVALRTGAKPLGPGGELPTATDVEAGELPQAPGAVRRKPGRGALRSLRQQVFA